MVKVFDYLNEINSGKKDIMVDKETEKEYLPFIINTGLSYFPDTLYYANMMNMCPNLSKRLQYHYYLNSIRPKKRFSKWNKNEKNDKIDILMKHYNINHILAKEYLKLLTEEQYNYIVDLHKET
jgi:hypothetical protein